MEPIQKKVNDLIKKYHTANPFRLCEHLNIKVFKCSMAGNGMYHIHKRIPMIYLNENLSEEQMIKSCAHELAHHLFHRQYNRIFLDNNTYLKKDRYEIEADLFAHILINYQDDIHVC